MVKFSIHNLFGRIIFFFLGAFPFCFYLFLKIIFNWEWHLNLGFLFFCIISAIVFIIHFKFGCIDWDFYINSNRNFIFNRMQKKVYIDINSPFTIEPIFIGTFFFSTWKIIFKSGEIFYFRAKPFKMALFLSLTEHAKKIEQEVRDIAFKVSATSINDIP